MIIMGTTATQVAVTVHDNNGNNHSNFSMKKMTFTGKNSHTGFSNNT